MALHSQMSRTGASRRYMSSGRRRRRRWRWVAIVLVLLALGAGWMIFGGRSSSGESRDIVDAGGAEPDEREQDHDASSRGEGGAAAERSPAPLNTLRAAPAPEVPTLNLTEINSTRTRSEAGGLTATSRGAGSTSGSGSASATSANTRTSTDSSTRTDTTPRTASRSTTNRTDASPRDAAASYTGTGSAAVRRGMDLIADGELVEGRQVLSELLFDDSRRLAASDARAIRETLASVNQKLVYSPEVVADDPLAESYRVQSGDLLSRIAPRFDVTFQFLEQINGIDARRLQVGQTIKLIRGPFHARVSKSEFRMDIYLRQPDGSPIYVRSFDVGLGEDDSTPRGRWIIEPNRKVVNPDWRNPRTGEYYASDDPENPIGNFWLALRGVDENTEGQSGYGIHGTIDPDSVGQAVSMGCIRLRDGDIEEVFYLLIEGDSTVDVVR